MNKNIEFLNYVFQNTKMGSESTHQVLEKIEDEHFKKLVEKQQKEYQKFNKEAVCLLEKHHKEEKDLSAFSKINSYIMIEMSLLKDSSDKHIAEMLVKGSNMGIIDIKKNLNQYDDLEKEISKLGNDLLEFEEKNIEKLKPFL